MITRLEKNKKIQDKIIKEENKKRFLKISKILSITLGIILLILCLGMFVGAKIVLVKEYRIEKNNIPSSFHGIKIVQISDLLYNSFSKNDLDKITKQVNELEPDILIFTGDIKRKDYKLSKKDIELLENFFKNMNASIKKYAVTGDLDDDSFNLIMENSNFILLNNEIDSIFYKDSTPIDIIGFNTNNLDFEKTKSERFSICLLHNPDEIDTILENVNCNIAFAGDTLGGEIKLFGEPVLDNHKYKKDYYKIKDTEFYISNGLGNESNIRFFNHPSISLYRLVTY